MYTLSDWYAAYSNLSHRASTAIHTPPRFARTVRVVGHSAPCACAVFSRCRIRHRVGDDDLDGDNPTAPPPRCCRATVVLLTLSPSSSAVDGLSVQRPASGRQSDSCVKYPLRVHALHGHGPAWWCTMYSTIRAPGAAAAARRRRVSVNVSSSRHHAA
jgi:hypothetical protein